MYSPFNLLERETSGTISLHKLNNISYHFIHVWNLPVINISDKMAVTGSRLIAHWNEWDASFWMNGWILVAGHLRVFRLREVVTTQKRAIYLRISLSWRQRLRLGMRRALSSLTNHCIPPSRRWPPFRNFNNFIHLLFSSFLTVYPLVRRIIWQQLLSNEFFNFIGSSIRSFYLQFFFSLIRRISFARFLRVCFSSLLTLFNFRPSLCQAEFF